jgi:hypothetical protein
MKKARVAAGFFALRIDLIIETTASIPHLDPARA